MWYKVLVFPEAGELISLQFDWDASEARLQDIPLEEGGAAEVNVAVFFVGGYAYSEYISLRWEAAQTSQGDDPLSGVEASAPPADLFLSFRVEDVRGGSGFISPFGIIRHSRDAGHGHGGIEVDRRVPHPGGDQEPQVRQVSQQLGAKRIALSHRRDDFKAVEPPGQCTDILKVVAEYLELRVRW